MITAVTGDYLSIMLILGGVPINFYSQPLWRQLLTPTQWLWYDVGECKNGKKKKGWHAPPPHCCGWPQASCGADCPDFPKSSSDPHCGLRILIGRIFLCHPSSLNTFCNHLCRKLTVTMIITFAERPLKKAHWKPVRRERGLLDFYTSNFGPPISGSYNSTFWSLA